MKESLKVLQECAEIQARKSNDYQNENSRIRQADYYPRGVMSIMELINTKTIRLWSVLEAMENDPNYEPNFEGVEDSLKDLINYSLSLYLDQGFEINNQSLQNELSDFLMDRLKYHMKEENIRNDIIQASTSSFNLDQSVIIFNKAKHLNKIINKPNGLDIIASYKRASNILDGELKKDKIELSNTTDPGIFKTELEKNLFKKISELRKYFSGINKDENYVQTLDNLASVKREVFDFFDNVIVNEDDLVIKKNRLELIQMMCKTFNNYVNFALIDSH